MMNDQTFGRAGVGGGSVLLLTRWCAVRPAGNRKIVIFYDGENEKEVEGDPSVGINRCRDRQALFDQKEPTRLEKPFIGPVYPWEEPASSKLGSLLSRAEQLVVPLFRLRGQCRRRHGRSRESEADQSRAYERDTVGTHHD